MYFRNFKNVFRMITLFLLLFFVSFGFSGEILFEVKDNSENTIMSVQDDGIWIMNSIGDTLMTVNNDSIRFGIDNAMQRSFAIQQSGSRKDKNRVDGSNVLEIADGDEINKIYDAPMMLWYPVKNAFRVGQVLIAAPDSVGTNSFASGYKSQAKGEYSFSTGRWSSASGNSSIAMGTSSTASAWASFASGYNSEATQSFAIAMGREAKSYGYGSLALGYNSEALADYSVALGYVNKATRSYSTAMGQLTEAVGPASTAMGRQTYAIGWNSTAMGYETDAYAYCSTVLGRFNVVEGDSNSWNSTDPLFVVGNGSSSTARNNAFTVLKNGNTNIDGEVNRTPTGSANMVPIAYGFINSDGSTNTGTGNISSIWNSSGNKYEITINDFSYMFNTFITTITPAGGPYTTRVTSSGGKLIVYIYNSSGTPVQSSFQFVTYKP